MEVNGGGQLVEILRVFECGGVLGGFCGGVWGYGFWEKCGGYVVDYD